MTSLLSDIGFRIPGMPHTGSKSMGQQVWVTMLARLPIFIWFLPTDQERLLHQAPPIGKMWCNSRPPCHVAEWVRAYQSEATEGERFPEAGTVQLGSGDHSWHRHLLRSPQHQHKRFLSGNMGNIWSPQCKINIKLINFATERLKFLLI